MPNTSAATPRIVIATRAAPGTTDARMVSTPNPISIMPSSGLCGNVNTCVRGV